MDSLVDPFGRPVSDLRIAITRDCNLACYFCHKEGASPGERTMSSDGIARLVRIGSALGVRSVKITGGEPLMRPDLEDIVRAIRPSLQEVSIVTNGHLLPERAESLRNAGLDRLNISLHAIDAAERPDVARAHRIVSRAVVAARAAGIAFKVNLVVTQDNLAVVPEAVAWAQDLQVPLQLIELHANPAQWTLLQSSFASLDETEAWLATQATGITRHRLHSRPVYQLPRAPVEVTRPMDNWRFCAGCKRLRLTADGMFQTCLLQPRFVDVLGPMRSGATDMDIAHLYHEVTGLREPTWRAPDGAPTEGARKAVGGIVAAGSGIERINARCRA
jgi:GTP 3',8-cyclase